METENFPHAKRMLWAGFFTIFAAGVGFAVRTGVLAHWARDYGFTQTELGEISGGGLWGFGVVIILGSLIADRVGYGRLMVFAFIMHVLSAVLQLCTDPIYQAAGGEEGSGQTAVFWSLTIAMVMFSMGNGICEVVVNPMVAALFPQQKTHYLNILHAGWPGGLVAGSVISYVMNDLLTVPWVIQMSTFLLPVAIYAWMLAGHKMPRSEASQAGVSYSTMLMEFVAPMLILLLIIHALVGYVELGTDNWMPNILNRILEQGGALFLMYTSILMFTLRFFAGPIESRISPLGLLFASAVIAATGLTLFGFATGVIVFFVAATVYAIGKTFFWPTMLAVVSERFPRGGALTLGAIGGCGMLSAGLLGAPGIGFKQDSYSASKLKEENSAIYYRYAADKPNHFLTFTTTGLDGRKTGLLDLEHEIDEAQQLITKKPEEAEKIKKRIEGVKGEIDRTLAKNKDLKVWWDENGSSAAANDWKPINEAKVYGGRMAFRLTALVPATMAVLYLLLILYFSTQGGYKKVELVRPIPGSDK
jgi:MFS family permease